MTLTRSGYTYAAWVAVVAAAVDGMHERLVCCLVRFGGFGHAAANETFDVGRDLGSSVGQAYGSRFPFQGKVAKLRVSLQGEVRTGR